MSVAHSLPLPTLPTSTIIYKYLLILMILTYGLTRKKLPCNSSFYIYIYIYIYTDRYTLYNFLLLGFIEQVHELSPSYYSHSFSSYYLPQPSSSCDQGSTRLHTNGIALTLIVGIITSTPSADIYIYILNL